MAKRSILAILLALAMLFSTTAAVAFAAEDDSSEAYITNKETAGQKLYEMGLMSGQGTNPDGTPDLALDKPVTRIETVAMLVNLLGHGSDLDALKEDSPYMFFHSFTDVPAWADAVVGYAYGISLTSGTSQTTFGSDLPMTVTQYLTFLLKVLGYDSEKDFRWDQATELSDTLGLTRGEYAGSEEMTRGDLAVLAVNALPVQTKDESGTLLEHIQAHVEWSIDEAGTLHISGKGPMPDYESYTNAPWRWDSYQSVVVEEGITCIGEDAFSMSTLKTISLPDSLVSIRDGAFTGCPLTEITIPNSVKHIGNMAFYHTMSLEKVVLPEGLKTIPSFCFAESGIMDLEIPSSVTTIEGGAFNFGYMEQFEIPATVTEISPSAFFGCMGLQTFVVDPANPVYTTSEDGTILLTKEGAVVSYPSSATNSDIVFPDGITSIGIGTIELSYRAMPDYIQSVTIPASVTALGEGLFEGLTGLTDIYFGGTEEQWAAISAGTGYDADTVTVHCNWTGN